jgi:nitrous oxidase accessory protein NosD
VRNVQQGTWFATPDGSALEDAITAATPGERLNVFGTCVGNFAIDRDLTVSGSHAASKATTLSGGGTGRVLFIAPDVDVRLTHLTISGGDVSTPGGGGGLLVNDGATVTLAHSTVIANSTTLVGGGIVNGGALTVIDSSVVRNHAVSTGDGGGIYNYGQLTVIHSRLWSNTAGGAGGGLFNESSATLRRSSVKFNRAGNAGGILNVGLLLLDHTVVSTNSPTNCEGC